VSAPKPAHDLIEGGALSLKAPSRQGLAERVYEALKEALLFEEILPETRLNLEQIARDLGVSNTPVREALGQLEADGLVRREAYKGYTALPQLDAAAVEEMYEFRLLVEPTLAAKAALRRSEPALRELEAWVSEMVAQSSQHGRDFLITAANRDAELHIAVANMAGNRIAASTIERLFHRMRSYSVGYYPLLHQANALGDGWREHGLVVDGIRRQKPDDAGAAMESHLMLSWERMRNEASSDRQPRIPRPEPSEDRGALTAD
jgi:DNA-binding GntR family transcriptional regulator